MKKVRLLSLLLALVMVFSLAACDHSSDDREDEEEEAGFVARKIVFHSEYEDYYYFDEVEPYLQTYFQSIETACHEVLEEGKTTFELSEKGVAAQKKLQALQEAAEATNDATLRAEYVKLFLPYLNVRTQELTANVAISLGNPPEKSCQALLDVLNEAYATYKAAP